jgi:hypothetical protein
MTEPKEPKLFWEPVWYPLFQIKNPLEYMRKQIGRWKAWRKARRDASRLALFHELLNRPDSGVMELVKAVANAQAVEIYKKFLDSRRVARCQFCVRTDQLRKHGPGYICPAHHEALHQVATTQTTAIIK